MQWNMNVRPLQIDLHGMTAAYNFSSDVYVSVPRVVKTNCNIHKGLVSRNCTLKGLPYLPSPNTIFAHDCLFYGIKHQEPSSYLGLAGCRNMF